ncbi:winged helix-turn-helix domain-containing protein [Dactylosporangium sp. NPDC048998]|uniref:winged helix-turn-helix domain-containing protein n=1 Tax=Dactylosporangium sp. NPDC048998 TaxID=3363976 RepID=UPI0037228D3B
MIDQKAAGAALGHPVRVALMELLRARGTVTSTEAARELGGSSGLHSFHLRQLARYGLVEEAPGSGRSKPWRLAGAADAADPANPAGPAPDADAAPDLGALARGLEDESYRRWLAMRDEAPARWRRDDAFSQVVYLTPREMAELANAVRALIAGYRHREERRGTGPAGAGPVAVVARFFPLLGPDTGGLG